MARRNSRSNAPGAPRWTYVLVALVGAGGLLWTVTSDLILNTTSTPVQEPSFDIVPGDSNIINGALAEEDETPCHSNGEQHEWVVPTHSQTVSKFKVTLLRTTDARRAPSAHPSCDRGFDYPSGTDVQVEARSGNFSWVTDYSEDDWAWILTSSFSEGHP